MFYRFRSLVNSLFLVLPLLLVQLISNGASALTISHPQGSSFGDFNKPTHVLVVGYAGGLGSQLFRVAAHRAKKYLEHNPSHAVVVIGPDKVDLKIPSLATYEGYKGMLKTLRLNAVLMDERWLLDYRLLEILLKYQNIMSLDFVSHSSAHQGVGLDDVPEQGSGYKFKRFNSKTKGLEQLAKRMNKESYVILHGCNSAFQQAPEMAKMLNVPVSGSMTYTNFQELFQDKEWYFNDTGKYPANLSRAVANSVSFKTPVPCSAGVCHRMQPEPYPYSGFWGKLTAGISHYKFFCGTKQASDLCKKAMARSLMSYMTPVPLVLSSSDDAFKQAAKDFLCPDASRPSERAKCFEAMEKSLVSGPQHFTGMTRGKTASCDFQACDVTVTCTDEPGSCKTEFAGNGRDLTTMAREFIAYVQGFQLLKSQP